jgi:cytochrome c oxidase assembly protein subunit 15
MSTPASAATGLYRYSLVVTLATLGLVCMGGLVTSKGVGMAVPDWPTSFGYNMFALPISTWKTGGIFDEHTHRIWASTVGLLVVFLTRWVGGAASRKSLAWIGSTELAVGVGLLVFAGSNWRNEAHFLMGISAVVLLAAISPWGRSPSSGTAVRMAWMAFWTVQFQGSLGGLRVVLDQWTVAGTTGGILFGVAHGCLGQLFFALLVCLTFRLAPGWDAIRFPASNSIPKLLSRVACLLVFGQLLLGLLMRHQHAGLAIPDLPLAHGQLWPATDAASLERYSARRDGFDSITAFQIQIHMLHRINALLTLAAVVAVFVRTRALPRETMARRLAAVWFGLVSTQFTLGILTVLYDKPADIATAHVAVGSLSLSAGILTAWLCGRTNAASAGERPGKTSIPQMTTHAAVG